MPPGEFGVVWDPKNHITPTDILLDDVSLVLEEHLAEQLMDTKPPSQTSYFIMHPPPIWDRRRSSNRSGSEGSGYSDGDSIFDSFRIAGWNAKTPTHSINPAEMYTAADNSKHLRVDINDGRTTFLPSEARRINTPPLYEHKKKTYFFDMDDPDPDYKQQVKDQDYKERHMGQSYRERHEDRGNGKREMGLEKKMTRFEDDPDTKKPQRALDRETMKRRIKERDDVSSEDERECERS